MDPNSKQIEFEVVVDSSANLDLPFDLEASTGGIGLSVDIAPRTSANIDASFAFGLDLQDLVDGDAGTSFGSEDAYVRLDHLNASASIRDLNINSQFQLGMLAGGIQNGSAEMEVLVDVGFHSDLDSDADGFVTLQDFLDHNGGSLIDVSTSGPDGGNMLAIRLPLSANLGGLNLGDINPSIQITDADLFREPAPEITTTDLGDFANLSSLNPGDVVLMLVRLGDEIQHVASEFNPESGIPFVDTAIEEVVDLSGNANRSGTSSVQGSSSDREECSRQSRWRAEKGREVLHSGRWRRHRNHHAASGSDAQTITRWRTWRTT